MAFQEKIGARSVRLAMSALALVAAGQAAAQEAPMQRVEITGSAIKRIAVEGALPVQRLSAETIKKTGANTVAELIQALPAMQGFSIEATAAGSNSGGRVSASIHDLGEEYTLVLLNGRRVAPQGSGSAVNLNAIPMSAVERVEILTDGASALYGSDAIAGVINFILKSSVKTTTLEATMSQPFESSSGRSTNFNITSGWAGLDDRLTLVGTYRHDERKQLKATDREFSKTAFIPFSANGNNYIYDRTSTATVPANVDVVFSDPTQPSIAFSPYLKKNGRCPAMNFESITNSATSQNCAFDFVSTIEVVPESKRDSLFGKATFKLTDSVNLYAEAALSRLDLTARIAPNSAPFTITTASQYYTDNVLPYLSPAQAASVKSVSGNYRTYDWGTRDSQTITDSTHLVVGAEGELGAWNFNTGLTFSKNEVNERYVGGYALNKEFRDMLAKRSFDPFAPIGQQSDATKQLIANSIFHGSVREESTTLKGVDLRGSRELFDLAGGKAALAVGGDFRNYVYEQTPSTAAATGVVYNLNVPATYDMDRDTYGVFAEMLAPVAKGLELTGAVRYDGFSAIDNGLTGTKIGKRESATTYKLSARWQPTQTMLVRGSYGTGFKAPSMLDLGRPLVNNGFTAGSFACPIAHAEYCRPGAAQYNQVAEGNPDLKPEKSKQFTIGFRMEPTPAFSFGADLWDVKMRDKVSAISELQAFEDAVTFRHLFTTYTVPATGKTYWAFKSRTLNIGKTHNQGIDWDVTGRKKFDFGSLSSTLAGTYMIKADYTEPGYDNKWTSNMNFFGSTNAVTFRHVVRWTTTLDTGPFSNSIIVNYRNGYTDAEATVRNTGTGKNEKIRLQVPSFMTFDWQGKWTATKEVSLRAGIKNLFDRTPPLSLRNSSGHQVGYDPRYADPMGRTFYLTGAYAF